MKVKCIWEHNKNDSLVYADNFIGAFTRGDSLENALGKMSAEITSYMKWTRDESSEELEIDIVQEKVSELEIKDADSDVLFDSEKESFTLEEYTELKELVLKSAADFLSLYEAIPDKDESCLSVRKTFYGQIPRTAEEMYLHTKNVNSYYFGEVGIDVDNEGSILECRKRGFELLEKTPDFLKNEVLEGSYGEMWSLRKVMRRFIWHDRIHAKAMWRMAEKTFGKGVAPNIFSF